jgi:hypothetical protein
MQGDMMFFLDINSDPGATAKKNPSPTISYETSSAQESRTTEDRQARRKKIKRYEDQCLMATIGAFAKAQANHHLSAGS